MTTESEVPIGPIVDSTKIPAAKVNGIPTPKATTGTDRSSVDGEVPSPDMGCEVVATADQLHDEPVSENDTEAAGPIVPKTETEVDADAVSEIEDESPKILSYHQDADMYFRMVHGTYLMVCSALIAAASPGFRGLVDSMKPGLLLNGKPVLDLSDISNDVFGLDIILSIIHL
jgi:hypothetical protein